MPCDGETVMAAGLDPNPWGEAQRRTRAAPFLQRSGREEPACRRGKKEACEGFGGREGCHRS